jgi:hypothetical protein
MKTFKKTKIETFYPLWVKLDYAKYTSTFEKIRCLMPYKADRCFKCDKRFKCNQIIALVGLKYIGNKVFCHNCAEEISS